LWDAALWPRRRLYVKAGAMSGKDEERSKRLAEALRENLRRRKAQAREAPSFRRKSESMNTNDEG